MKLDLQIRIEVQIPEIPDVELTSEEGIGGGDKS